MMKPIFMLSLVNLEIFDDVCITTAIYSLSQVLAAFDVLQNMRFQHVTNVFSLQVCVSCIYYMCPVPLSILNILI